MSRCNANAQSRNPFIQFQLAFERGFEGCATSALRVLELCIDNSAVFLVLFVICSLASLALTPELGQDFFPSVDSGEFILRTRPYRNAH